jgi:hypothetical protein
MGLAGGTAASGPVPNGNFRFMFRYGTSGYWAGQVAWGGFGASLTQADNTALYNALANYMAGLAGTQMVAESVAIFAGMTVPPTVARRQRINDAVVALKAGGVWAKLDAVYAFAAADSQAAKINWVQPGTYNCTEVSAPAFTVDQGFTGNGTSSYLDTNFNISSAAGRKFAQNDAMIAGWSLTNIDVNAGVVGTSLQDTCILPRLTNLAYGYINDLFGNWPNLDGTGFYCLTRRSATAKELYRNGVSIGTSAQSSSAVVNSTLRFLRYSTGHWAGQCAAGAVGSQLSAVEQLALYEALLAYQTGIATDAIAASFVTPPTAARKSLIQTCVGALMRAGVWNKLDVLHMFAAADSQAAKINWVKPGTYNATEVSAPTFVADAGFTGGGAAYLDTNFEINGSPAPKYTLNSALFSVWTNGSYTSVSATLGSAGGLVDGIYPKYTDNHFYGRLTAGAGTSDGGIVASSAGLKTITRTGVGTLAMYDGGTKVSSPTTASTGLPTAGDNVTGYALGGVPCWVIGGGITDAEQLALYNALNAYIASTRIFAAFTTPPTPARQTLIQNAVASLMTAGVWDKLDRLYMFAAADSQAALINWKQPGTGDATLVNAPAFVADRGFTGGSTKYINCNFNSTIGSPNITANSACLFGRALTDVKEVNCMWGNTATNTTGMHPHYTDDTALGRVFQTTANASVACTNAVAFWSTNRSGASAEQMYKDGSQVATVSVASLGLITQYVVLTNAPNLYWTGQIGSHGIGASLNATEQLALYNAERAYMTGVGVP